jgi:hypothetical protein
MYKEILKRLDRIKDIGPVIEYYSGTLFQYSENSDAYELIFNRQFNSPVVVPKIKKEDILSAPKFYLDDDDIVLPLDRVLILVVVDRLEYLRKENYKYRHHKLLKKDINAVIKAIDSVEPTSYNNKLKLSGRIKIMKTYEVDKKSNIKYYDAVGKALWDSKVPNTAADIRKYSMMFNDPISVASPTEGVYCDLKEKTYRGAGYFSDADKIVSIYETKSSLPERLRIQYTSSFLVPETPDIDYLIGESEPDEKTNAITIFLPVASNKVNPMDKPHPFGKWTLLTGEVLIDEELSKKNFFVRRTFLTNSLNVNVIEEGDILQPGDVIAYDAEDKPCLIYDLNYENAIVEEVQKLWNGYKIIVKVISQMGVARVVSETGLKGVTHPKKDLGFIHLPNWAGHKELKVNMVVGPMSLKSGHNGIKLAWASLMSKLFNGVVNINPSLLSAEDVEDQYTESLQKVEWHFNGEIYEVYAGLISFGVTDLAKDCKSKEVRIMPETLKYMYLSNNEYLIDTAKRLVADHVSKENKWSLSQLLKLKSNKVLESDNVPVYKWNSAYLQNTIASSFFNTANWTNNQSGLPTNNILLNPFNSGFYVQFFDIAFRFPSSDIINYLTYVGQGHITYPQFLTHAIFLLMSIKSYYQNKATIEQVLTNYKSYIFYVDDEIFSKKSSLPKCVSPVVMGGNLKQLVSPLVPRGVTVVIDSNLERQISDFSRRYDKQIWDIGVRNPVIWRFQFMPRKVWTFKRFVRHIEQKGLKIEDVLMSDGIDGAVLRNTVDVAFDRADSDGDLYPVTIPMDIYIQDNLNKYMKSPMRIKEYEKQWIFEYIDSELSKNEKFIDVEKKPFEFYSTTREDFSILLANSAIAKAKVGVATVDLWKFHAAAELLYSSEIITKDQLDYQMFLFSSIVQNTVIEGIKHVEGGASGYDTFMLAGMEANQNTIKTVLTDSMGVTKDAADMFVSIGIAANKDEFTRAISRIPNGGMSSYVGKMAVSLKNIPSYYRNTISYCRIIEPYFDSLVKVLDNQHEADDENLEPTISNVDY